MNKEIFGKQNIVILVVGILLLIIGFVLLGSKPWDNPTGLTLAPIVLTLAYLIVIPMGILFKGKNKKGD